MHSTKANRQDEARSENQKHQDIDLPTPDHAPDEPDSGDGQAEQGSAFGSDFDEGLDFGRLAESTQEDEQKQAGSHFSTAQAWTACGENAGKKHKPRSQDDLEAREQMTALHSTINEAREVVELQTGDELVEAIQDVESLASVEIPKEIPQIIRIGVSEMTLKQPTDQGSLGTTLTGRHTSAPAKASTNAIAHKTTPNIRMRASSVPIQETHAHHDHPAYPSEKVSQFEQIAEEAEFEEDPDGRPTRAKKAKKTPCPLDRRAPPSLRSNFRDVATDNQARKARVTIAKRGLEPEEVGYSPPVKKARFPPSSGGGKAALRRGEGLINAATNGMEDSMMDIMQVSGRTAEL